jgi:hypothetical protein
MSLPIFVPGPQWRVAEDEIITAILRRGSGTDLEDVGTDGLGLGQKAGLFDIPVKDTGDLPAAVNKGAELRPAAERLQTHGAGAAEQVGYNHIFEHTLGVEDAEQRFFDPVGDRTGVIALGWQELLGGRSFIPFLVPAIIRIFYLATN